MSRKSGAIQYAEHGNIVIAALNSEQVCKRLEMHGNSAILRSENPKYPPGTSRWIPSQTSNERFIESVS